MFQLMRTSERLTIGSNRSLRSLGRAKARPLTKTLGVTVITKKITQGMDEKLLKIIYKRYTQMHGYGTRKLNDYKVLITGGELFEEEMPEIVERDANNNIKRYLLLDLLQELKAKNYLEVSADNTIYWLSNQGYQHASKNKFEHFITYLNNNSGWAIPLALLSLIVSIVALFTSN